MSTQEHNGRRDPRLTSRSGRKPLKRRQLGDRQTQYALAVERRRVAGDVHDLIMQELSLALSSARAMLGNPSAASEAVGVVRAGERALAGARAVIASLTDHDHRPIAEAVQRSVWRAAGSTPVTFDFEHSHADAEPDALTHDALVHIARESVANAVKHAQAHTIEVMLVHHDEWHLRVCDDGRGFSVEDAIAGFGLKSMRECATALGGSFSVKSARGLGATVEATLP